MSTALQKALMPENLARHFAAVNLNGVGYRLNPHNGDSVVGVINHVNYRPGNTLTIGTRNTEVTGPHWLPVAIINISAIYQVHKLPTGGFILKFSDRETGVPVTLTILTDWAVHETGLPSGSGVWHRHQETATVSTRPSSIIAMSANTASARSWSYITPPWLS